MVFVVAHGLRARRRLGKARCALVKPGARKVCCPHTTAMRAVATRQIWLQLARHELTIAEAADLVDRSTIIRIRAVAKDRALAALAESRGEGPASGMWS